MSVKCKMNVSLCHNVKQRFLFSLQFYYLTVCCKKNLHSLMSLYKFSNVFVQDIAYDASLFVKIFLNKARLIHDSSQILIHSYNYIIL